MESDHSTISTNISNDLDVALLHVVFHHILLDVIIFLSVFVRTNKFP